MGYIDPKLVEGAAALVESFTCAICFNLFEKPRTACSKGHTFCAECLHAEARLYFSSPFRESTLNGDPARFTIYIHKLTGEKMRLKVGPYDLCLALKHKIREKWNFEVAQQMLIFRGQQLVDGSKLYDSSIFDGAVVHLIVRTRVPPPQPLPPI